MPSFFEKLFKAKATADPAPSQPPKSATAPGQAATRFGTEQTPSAPDGFDALYTRALSAAASKDFARAIPLYDQAIAASPAGAEPYYKRANALKDVGRLEEAIASYDRAIELKPDYAYAFVIAASCNKSSAYCPRPSRASTGRSSWSPPMPWRTTTARWCCKTAPGGRR